MTNIVFGCVVAAMTAVAILGILIVTQEDTGRHVHGSGRRSLRPRALLASVELWLRWWEWPAVQAHYTRQYRRADRKAFAAEMAAAAPIVSEAEVREEFARMPLAPAPRRPVNGRHLGTQPRRTPGPFTAADMPTLPPPPIPAVPDPGDGLTDIPLVPCHGQLVFNQAPQLVVEPELAKVMMP